MAEIRTAGIEDAEAIDQVRRLSWQAGYAGVVPQETIDELTGPGGLRRIRENFRRHPHRRVFLAEAGSDATGFAAYGPPRGPGRSTAPDLGGTTAELYSLYVVPEHWSTGTGRALMAHVIDNARRQGYAHLQFWVLEGNERARRFYERTGCTPTGERELVALGDVVYEDLPEIRYTRAL